MHHCVVSDWLLFYLSGTVVLSSSFILGFSFLISLLGSILLCNFNGVFDRISNSLSRVLGHQCIRVRGRSVDKLGDEGESGGLRQLPFEQHRFFTWGVLLNLEFTIILPPNCHFYKAKRMIYVSMSLF